MFILSVSNYSCSKKDHWTLGRGEPLPPLIEYPIDLNFTINPSCSISYSDDTLSEAWSKNFEFNAYSDSSLPNDSSGSYMKTSQVYSYYYEYESCTDATFDISTREQSNPSGKIFLTMLARENFNFFTLPYQSGIASFSDTCYVIYGGGKYKTVDPKTSPLIFSGFVDLVNGTGIMRIKGSIYLR
jgi:hypothetical protein